MVPLVQTLEDDCIFVLERIRWPDGLTCIRCSSREVRRLNSARPGRRQTARYWCAACRYQYSVTVGTPFQHSHLTLANWWRAIHMLSSEQERVSAKQLAREFGISYESAWNMVRRVRSELCQPESLCSKIATLTL
jgi:transposase-like protein